MCRELKVFIYCVFYIPQNVKIISSVEKKLRMYLIRMGFCARQIRVDVECTALQPAAPDSICVSLNYFGKSPEKYEDSCVQVIREILLELFPEREIVFRDMCMMAA